MEKKRISTRGLVVLALFTAIVVVLQLLGSFIRFGPFSISLTLVPIVVGAALYGVGAGAWLGFAFSFVVLLMDSAAFMVINPLGTILTVLVKGTAAGVCAALVYRALAKKNEWLGVICAAAICPVVNTGLFLLGCLIFFMPTISEWAAGAGFPSAGNFLIFGMVGINFLAELVINMVLSPVILRLIRVGKKEYK